MLGFERGVPSVKSAAQSDVVLDDGVLSLQDWLVAIEIDVVKRLQSKLERESPTMKLSDVRR